MREPLYRRTYDATDLMGEHPAVFSDSHKRTLFEWAYPAGEVASGTIEVTRWAGHVTEPLALLAEIDSDVPANFYDYRHVSDGVEWHVNFADPRLFFAYGSRLFAQDEMQVAEHPVLASVREALVSERLAAKTNDETGPTPILVKNAERRLEIATNPDARAGRPQGLYGNRFADAPTNVIRQATERIDPPTYSNIIAMAAPSGGDGQYRQSEIEFIFTTAWTAFAAARHESGASSQTIVHTGFWGCGAFGGNRTLMVVLQALAARATGVSRLVMHAGDISGAEQARNALDIAENLAFRCGKSCSLKALVERVEMLGCEWGFSDGN